jgi:hypothetical protein
MKQRYFLIEPKYSDPDTFCRFTVGSDRVHTLIQLYADLWMLGEVASALTSRVLKEEWQDDGAPYRADICFDPSPEDASELVKDLKAWCAKPAYTFICNGA